eukprot:COSAG05_NODE_16744_length_339_cov_14.887500_1_plen_37_part_10
MTPVTYRTAVLVQHCAHHGHVWTTTVQHQYRYYSCVV